MAHPQHRFPNQSEPIQDEPTGDAGNEGQCKHRCESPLHRSCIRCEHNSRKAEEACQPKQTQASAETLGEPNESPILPGAYDSCDVHNPNQPDQLPSSSMTGPTRASNCAA